MDSLDPLWAGPALAELLAQKQAMKEPRVLCLPTLQVVAYAQDPGTLA